jgi:hypothetical protein
MGNFFTDTVGKIAGNVTQSVISALIVTAVTTYIIVSPGKKEGESGSAKDSAKTTTTTAPMEKVEGVKEPAGSSRMSTEASPPMNSGTSSTSAAGATKPVGVPATVIKTDQAGKMSPTTEAATKAYKELPPENAAEKGLESTISQGRAKGDSLAKAHPQDEKAQEVKKEEKKETKDVKKRADEVFDELDQEVKK